MPKRIIIPPDEVWDYICENEIYLETHQHKIAENPDFGTEIYISEDSGKPSVVVLADGLYICEDTFSDTFSCEDVIEYVYDLFLTEKAVEALNEPYYTYREIMGYDEEVEEHAFDIRLREADLYDSARDFVEMIYPEGEGIQDPDDYDFMIRDFMEHSLRYLYKKFGIPIYRPMTLEFEDGTEKFEEYPYEYLID